MPARDLWSHIQKEIAGRGEAEQLRALRQHLDNLHDEWKGPYKDLRDRLRRQVSRLENHDAVRSRTGQLDPFHIKRQGEATVAFAGAPNAGKSRLVQSLTGAATVVADYPFSTAHPVPGMLAGAGGALQLVDTPPVVEGLAAGDGAGRPLLHLLSQADAIVIVIDADTEVAAGVRTIFDELSSVDVTPVAGPLATVVKARGKGGVRCSGRTLSREDERAARTLVSSAHMEHADITVHTHFDAEQLQRQLNGEVLLPVLFAVRSRVPAQAEDCMIQLHSAWPDIPALSVDVDHPAALAMVRPALLSILGRVGIQRLQRASVEAEGTTVLVPVGVDVTAAAARAGITQHLRGARIWGPSAERPGQTVSLHHIVEADDRIFFVS